MKISKTITRVNDDVVRTVSGAVDELVAQVPESLAPLARRLGAVTIEVVHQSGRLSVLTLEVSEGIWQAFVTGISTLDDELEDRFDDAVRAAERAGRSVSDSVRSAARAVDDRLDDLEDDVEAGGRRLASEKDRAVTAVLDAGSPLAELTKDELYDLAQELDIDGRSTMSKDELLTAVRRAA